MNLQNLQDHTLEDRSIDRPIAIVGAGPTGLVTASLLGQAGIPVCLFERQLEPSNEPRAITIDDEGLRICQAIGIADELCKHALLNMSARYISQNRTLVHIAPRQQPNGYPLISTFHQPTLERLLRTNLLHYPSVTFYVGHTVTAIEQDQQQVTLTIQTIDGTTHSLHAPFVLACDGARSLLRQSMAVPFYPVSLANIRQVGRQVGRQQRPQTGQRWLILDTLEHETTAEHDQTAVEQARQQIIFFCNPRRPAVTVPAPEARRRWEFMLKPDEDGEQLCQPERARRLIKQACTTLPPGLSLPYAEDAKIQRTAIYTFHTLNAASYLRGRVFLLGDAAHLMPPFGGQGMNSGLRDAYNLCWKLCIAREGRSPQQVLQSYQRERSPHTDRMIRFSANLGALIMTPYRPLAAIRDLSLNTLNVLPQIRSYLSDMRIKPVATYTHGCLLPRHLTSAPRLTGTLFPATTVTLLQAQHLSYTCSLDALQGQRFLLLWLQHDTSQVIAHLSQSTTKFWTRLAVQAMQIVPDADSSNDGNDDIDDGSIARVAGEQLQIGQIVDHSGQLTRQLRRHKGSILLLRPDQYVMGQFRIARLRAIEQALMTLLGSE